MTNLEYEISIMPWALVEHARSDILRRLMHEIVEDNELAPVALCEIANGVGASVSLILVAAIGATLIEAIAADNGMTIKEMADEHKRRN